MFLCCRGLLWSVFRPRACRVEQWKQQTKYLKKRTQYETTSTSSVRTGLAKPWSTIFLTGPWTNYCTALWPHGTARICFNWRISQQVSKILKTLEGASLRERVWLDQKDASGRGATSVETEDCIFVAKDDGGILYQGLSFFWRLLKMKLAFVAKIPSFWRLVKNEAGIL